MDLVFASEPGSVDPHTEVLYELLGSAIKHGVLHQARIQSSNRKLRANEWHQEYFLLQGRRLWHYSPIKKGQNDKHNHLLPFIRLDSKTDTYSSGASLSYVDLLNEESASNQQIAYMENSSPKCTEFVVQIENPQNFRGDTVHKGDLFTGPIKIQLKAESNAEALSWVKAIRNNMESRPQLLMDDLLILQAELTITNEQMQHSNNDVETMLSTSTFEGALCNHYLRSKFRSFLEKSYCHESLLFWERAEDYRRGCPNTAADKAFSFGGAGASPTLLEQRDWAQSIFDRFWLLTRLCRSWTAAAKTENI